MLHTWNQKDATQSDDDDDNNRLVIDMSEKDEIDTSVLTSIPVPKERSSQPARSDKRKSSDAFFEACNRGRGRYVTSAEMRSLPSDVSAFEELMKRIPIGENDFGDKTKYMEAVHRYAETSPDFQKAIYKVDVSKLPPVTKSWSRSSGLTRQLVGPPLSSGCKKTLRVSSGGSDHLEKLDSYVNDTRAYGTSFSSAPPSTSTISTAPVSGNEGCEIVPIVSSQSFPCVTSLIKSRSNSRKRSSTTTKRKSGPSLANLGFHISSPKGSDPQFRAPLLTESVSIVPLPRAQTPPDKITFVVNTLQNAAHDQKHLQEFQRLTTSNEWPVFREFSDSLSKRPKDVPIAPTQSQMMMRGTERAESSHQMFYNSVSVSPVLTTVPGLADRGGNIRKPDRRRSPPPMLPIESFRFNRSLSENSMVSRLKRLGTDIELEDAVTLSPVVPAYSMTDCRSDCVTEDDDDDPLIPDCILSTEPIVTIDETADALPLNCFDIVPSTPKTNTARNFVPFPFLPPHPPPSLIPISLSGRILPSLPNVPRIPNTISKSKRKPKTAGKSEFGKLAQALVQKAGTAKNNDVEILNSGLYQPRTSVPVVEREVEIFKIQETPVSRGAKKPENGSESSIETIVRRLKQKPIENKTVSESVDAKIEDTTAETAGITLVTNAPSESPIDLLAVMNSLQVAETKTAEAEDQEETSESLGASNEQTMVENGATAEMKDEADLKELPALPKNTSSASPLFRFCPDNAVITSVVNDRKMYTCTICSGVYYKLCSLKKHYFRIHINPRMVNESDARKFDLETNATESPANEGFYRCNECRRIFVEMTDLKKHSLDHPVAANELKRISSYRCDHCGVTFSKKRSYSQHMLVCLKIGTTAPNSEAVPLPEAVPPVPKSDAEELDEDKKDVPSISKMCLFCDLTFNGIKARKSHVLQHHPPKRKSQSCSYCGCDTFNDLKELLEHINEAHSETYYGCALCRTRFVTKRDLTLHNAESHNTLGKMSPKRVASDEKTKPTTSAVKDKPASTLVTKSGKIHKCNKCSTTFPSDKELKRHRKKGHNVGKPGSSVKKVGAAGSSTEPHQTKYRPTDYETEFYRCVSNNVSYNLENFLDGKDIKSKILNDQKTVTRSGSSHLKTRSSTLQYLHNEQKESRISFEDMYGAENLNGKFIADKSRMHIATQLAVLRKNKPLDNEPVIESASTHHGSTTMAKELALTQTENVEGVVRPEEKKEDDDGKVVFSGEWTRPKVYICGSCMTEFNNKLAVEDHFYQVHANVGIEYYTFPADQVPRSRWDKKWLGFGAFGPCAEKSETNLPVRSPPSKCTKCQKVVTPTAEFHKHILECGGDTTWMSTMFASSSLKKHKKWKPYGGRRRKNVGRVRGLKRNIPTTPVKILGLPKNRQKAGDTETIQKMIANLPPKRITRRIVQFDDIEPKNRNNNSAVSESNILTRKRKEKLDAKMKVQTTKPSSTESALVKVSNAKTKKQKGEATSMTQSRKSKKSLKSKSSSLTAAEPSALQDQTSDSSPSISDLDVPAKEFNSTESNVFEGQEVKVKSEPTTAEAPVAINNPSASIPVKQEDEAPEIDLVNIEPADSDPCIPDSSIILAAMRETMRQTDAVIPTQTFTVTAKKRKRDDQKCKQDSLETDESCLAPESKIPAIACTVCIECNNPFTNVSKPRTEVCEKCSAKSGTTRSASLRPRGRNSGVRELRNTRKSIPKKILNSSTVECTDSENSKNSSPVKPDCTPKDDVAVNTKTRRSVTKVVKKNSTNKISKVSKTNKINADSKSSEAIEINKTNQHLSTCVSGESELKQSAKQDETTVDVSDDNAEKITNVTTVDVSGGNAEKITNVLENKTDQIVGNEMLPSTILANLKEKSKTVGVRKTLESESVEPNKNSNDPESLVKSKDGLELNIIYCEVCHQYPSVGPDFICDSCSSIAKKNKVCVFCKQNMPKPYYNSKPICDACKDSRTTGIGNNTSVSGSPWTQCWVCRRENHQPVCSSCVSQSQKHGICARCSVRLDHQRVGLPVCTSCEIEWYPENTDKCAEYSLLRSEKTTPQKLYNTCNLTDTNTEADEPLKNGNSNEISIQVNGNEEASIDPPVLVVVTDNTSAIAASSTNTAKISSVSNSCALSLTAPICSTITSMPPATSKLPTVTTSSTILSNVLVPPVTRSIPEDVQTNTSPSKKNRSLLRCLGCRRAFPTVSAYKDHCETCYAREARPAGMEDNKPKPLLGFVDCSAAVFPSDVNGCGPSFEVVDSAKLKSFPINESGKIASHLINETTLPVSVYDSDSSTSSKRLEHGRSAKSKKDLKKGATDESMRDSIESVIQTVCYSSAPEQSSPPHSVCKPPSRRPSGDAVETAKTNLENIGKVKNYMENTLEKLTAENESNLEILFPNEEQIIPTEPPSGCEKQNVAPKKKVSKRSRATRSSQTNNEVDESLKLHAKKCKVENNMSASDDGEVDGKNVSSSSNTMATRRRRKPSNILVADEEISAKNADSNTAPVRKRRKAPVEATKRKLRSRGRADANEEGSLIEGTLSSATKTRRSKESRKPDSGVDLREEKMSSVIGGEDQDDKTCIKKIKTESNDLGFPAVKSGTPTQKSAKQRDSAGFLEPPSKNELSESDRQVEQELGCESDKRSNSSISVGSDNVTADGASEAFDAEYSSPTSQSRCDFLGVTGRPTTAVQHNESVPVNTFSYDERMHLDGYEVSVPSTEQNQSNGVPSTTWYSFLDNSSLGSILASVNELLAGPEVVPSCVSNPINSQSVKDTQSDGSVSRGLDDTIKMKEENLFESENENPTLIDLDHQTAHHSGVDEIVKEEVLIPLDGEQFVGRSPMSSVDSIEDINDVCDQAFSDSETLKMRKSTVHSVNIFSGRKITNGKFRSSTRTNQNGLKDSQKCTQCQKVLVGREEMASHVEEHVKSIANRGDAAFLKKCIADKLEDIFFNNALNNHMKQESTKTNAPLKIYSQLQASRKNQQFGVWKSAITQMLNNCDSTFSTMSSNGTVKSLPGSVSATRPTTAKTSALKPSALRLIKQQMRAAKKSSFRLRSNADFIVNQPAVPDTYPCPMCARIFTRTNERNQHIILIHAPRTSTHPDGDKKDLDLCQTLLTNETNELPGPSGSAGKSDGKVIHSYLLNESVNSCLEAKKEAVHKAIAESTTFRNVNELRRQVGRPVDPPAVLPSVPDSLIIEGPPPLEPAPSGEHIPNNQDRSPPKLEASTGAPVPSVPAPSILRQNLTSSSTGGATSVSHRNGKPCRKKMSKKEIDLPPAVVKFKAEQALLELSINKFRKIRS